MLDMVITIRSGQDFCHSIAYILHNYIFKCTSRYFLNFLENAICRYDLFCHPDILDTHLRGVGKGGSRANFIHFLYKVLGQRSVQKKAFKN